MIIIIKIIVHFNNNTNINSYYSNNKTTNTNSNKMIRCYSCIPSFVLSKHCIVIDLFIVLCYFTIACFRAFNPYISYRYSPSLSNILISYSYSFIPPVHLVSPFHLFLDFHSVRVFRSLQVPRRMNFIRCYHLCS